MAATPSSRLLIRGFAATARGAPIDMPAIARNGGPLSLDDHVGEAG
ncbi:MULTISPECIES: hypothetical protein [Bosea]|uniref:Uncharacterized protein n=1 Tax=Bosea spartocytisi TaxID=2773451 RepID=A0A927I1B6_9HYPH|nr:MULTISPECIES: hypothetical protein [Bosea]MBD3847406.1 hypothetical protein [Bosea spartocytisi]MCT4475507.1 hypothetical protein [Bosea spartocytisi]